MSHVVLLVLHLFIWCNNDAAREKPQVLLSDGFETFITNCTDAGRLDLVNVALTKGVGEIAIHRHLSLKPLTAGSQGKKARSCRGTGKWSAYSGCSRYVSI